MADFLFDRHLLVGTIDGQRYERENKTENDVEIPPARLITDSDGACWTFGTQYVEHNGEYQFNVLRNDVDTDEVAKRIVYRKGRVWIYGHYGWKHFSQNRRSFI